SRENDSETLSPETFGARSEQACSDRAPNDLSKCPPERRAARNAETLGNTDENANSRGPHPRLFVLTRVPQSSRRKCLAPQSGLEPGTNRLTDLLPGRLSHQGISRALRREQSGFLARVVGSQVLVLQSVPA